MRKAKRIIGVILLAVTAIVANMGVQNSNVVTVQAINASPPPAAINTIFPDSVVAEYMRIALGMGSITDVVTQAQLDQIKQVNLRSEGVFNINGFEYLQNIEEIDLAFNQISDVSMLASLNNLERLYLDHNQIDNIASVSGLVQLTTLDIGYNPIKDISPISGLTNITTLGLYSLSLKDLTPIANLTKMSQLFLGGNQISDINLLSAMTDLTLLYAGGNQIKNISPLSALTRLADLDLSYNQISDISPLANLTGLWSLLLRGNQISDISPLSELNIITQIDLKEQTIVLPEVDFQSNISIDNIILNTSGQRISPLTISHGGSYVEPQVTWELSDSTTAVNFTFEQNYSIGSASGEVFSGLVIQPLSVDQSSSNVNTTDSNIVLPETGMNNLLLSSIGVLSIIGGGLIMFFRKKN